MSLAEFELIDWLRRRALSSHPMVTMGIGDDCAVLQGEGPLAVSVDSMVEGVHFSTDWCPPEVLGSKALRSSLSDLAAMGAEPFACLLALSLPAHLDAAYAESILLGFLEAGKAYACPLVGGNLSQASEISLAVTVWGRLSGAPPLYRHGARPGDRIGVAGSLGLAHQGLRLLQKTFTKSPSKGTTLAQICQHFPSEERPKIRAHLQPEPQLATGLWLRRQGIASALIDVSDGLASDLMHLAEASSLSAVLEADALRLESQRIGAGQDLDIILRGGEDYALLFTASAKCWSRISETRPEGIEPPRCLGEMRAGQPSLLIEDKNRLVEYTARGFRHFK